MLPPDGSGPGCRPSKDTQDDIGSHGSGIGCWRVIILTVEIIVRLPLVLHANAAVHAPLFNLKLDTNLYTNRRINMPLRWISSKWYRHY